MNIIDELEKSINESIDMDKKSTFSARLFNVLSLCCSLIATVLLFIMALTFLNDKESGIKIWMWIFYFVIMLIIVGMYFAIIQRIRGRYMTSTFSIVLCCICLLAMFLMIAVQIIGYGKVFIYPFTSL